MFAILLDVAPPIEFAATTIGVALAAVFFLITCAAALFAYKMMKRTVKMALRMVIVAVIFVIAVVGSLAFYFGIQTPQQKPYVRPTPRSAR